MSGLSRYGDWAVITGASSGLGREFARQIAAEGVNCVIVGLGQDALDALASELGEKHGVTCRPLEIDLASDDAIGNLTESLADLPIGILVNCAGVAHGGAFQTRNPEKLKQLVQLNCLAPLLLTREYLPQMLERQAGAVIIVSSLQAFISCPNEAAYCASKAFLMHFGESLWGELKDTPIDCLTVCPAGMKTDFFKAEGFSQADCDRIWRFSSSPEAIARLALRDLGRKTISAPLMTRFSAFLARILPRRWAIAIVTRVTRGLVDHKQL
ncbi:MAG: short-chain dehydrogenase [Candidatus Hydrogenedentota bacterium]